MYSVEDWLVTEGNQYVVAGEFRRKKGGEVEFVDRQGQPLPVPVWAIANMMEAYKKGDLRTGFLKA
jgi:hypothetical protein